MSGRGKPLELGLQHEANALLRSGRAALVRQFPRMAAGPGGTMRYVGEAPVDFLGARRGGASLALEAKETGRESFPLDEDHLSRKQIKACRALAAMDVELYLIIDFKRVAEVYAIAWVRVDAFLRAPRRASLSLDWVRAYGLLLPETDRDDTEKRRTHFLDGVVHPDLDAAHERVKAEHAACPVITLDELLPKDDARDERWAERRKSKSAEGESLAQLMARKPPKDAPEADRQRWLGEYNARELEENHKRARKTQRGRAAPWKGGLG